MAKKATTPKKAAKAAAKPVNGKAAPATVNGNGKAATAAAKPEAKPVQSPMPVLCKACAKQMGSDWEIKPVVNPERSDAAKRAWVTIRANREKAAAEAAANAAALAKAAKRGKSVKVKSAKA